MKANEDKRHVLISTNENVLVNIGTAQIQKSCSWKPLGVNICCKPNSMLRPESQVNPDKKGLL